MFIPLLVFVVCCAGAWRFRSKRPYVLWAAALIAAVAFVGATNGAPRRSVSRAAEAAVVVGILGCVVEMARVRRRQYASHAQRMDLFDSSSELVQWRLADTGAKSRLEGPAMREVILAGMVKSPTPPNEQAVAAFADAVLAKHARLISDPALNWKALLEPRERAAEEAWEEDQRLSQEPVFAMVSALILLALAFIQAFRH